MRELQEKHLAIFRRHMVDVIGIHADLASDETGKSELDGQVMAVMQEVPRHLFVPAPVASAAYEDMPLPICFNKTISQPFMVALMADLLEPQPNDRVLEVGTGLGYQAATLAGLVAHVWTVEIMEEFVESAEKRLSTWGSRTLACASVMVHAGGPTTRHTTRSSSLLALRKSRPL